MQTRVEPARVARHGCKAHVGAMNELHVVLGAGQIGNMVARRLSAKGHRVVQVRRGQGTAQAGVTLRSGDITDRAFAEDVARGATALYHCVNLPYDQWAGLDPITAGVLHAARTSRARLVVLDNLYAYGAPPGPMREDTPMNPCSRKGALRARQATMLLDAQQRGDVRLAIGRASDFYGPEVTLTGVFGERFFQRAFAGKSAECTGDPAQPHSYSFGPDVADGLVTLGEHEKALGQVWHLPVAPAESTTAVVERFSRELGRPLGVSRIPRLALKVMGLFSPIIRELPEMAYQWEQPFVVDDSKFRAAFGVTATSLDEGVRRTVEWARGVYGVRAAGSTPVPAR